MQEGLDSSNVVMEVIYHWGGYVFQFQDSARKLGIKNVVMKVVCQSDGGLVL